MSDTGGRAGWRCEVVADRSRIHRTGHAQCPGEGPTTLRELDAPLVEVHPCTPAGHALTDRAEVSLADLAAYPLITTDQPHSWQHMLDLFRGRGLSPVADRATSSFELQRSMVANGFGVAVSYTRPHGDRSYDGLPLICKPLSDPLPMQRIILTYDTHQRVSNAALAFVETAKAWFSTRDIFTS